jgi:hypothetical protein
MFSTPAVVEGSACAKATFGDSKNRVAERQQARADPRLQKWQRRASDREPLIEKGDWLRATHAKSRE